MTPREIIKRNGGATAVSRKCRVSLTTAFRWQSGKQRINPSARLLLGAAT